jgi:hypothetical protein
MYCPVCGDEYQPGFTRCADCDVLLTERAPENPPPEPPFELVTVLETGDQSLVTVVTSMLEDAGIPCIARNERLQNLFGWGAVGTGYSVAMGPVRIQVLREDEDVAKELLAAGPELQDESDDA